MNAPSGPPVPPPPPEIEAELEAAHDDEVRFGIARAKYAAWLADQGYEPGGPHGTTRPDGSIR